MEEERRRQTQTDLQDRYMLDMAREKMVQCLVKCCHYTSMRVHVKKPQMMNGNCVYLAACWTNGRVDGCVVRVSIMRVLYVLVARVCLCV